jgi:RNA polymerase sigma factor (sigma-70 family)
MTPHPSEKLSAEERGIRVRAAVENLPPRQRATVALAYFEGLSYPEVAGALGCSVGTVKTQVSRAMQTLARILPPPDFDGRANAGGVR